MCSQSYHSKRRTFLYIIARSSVARRPYRLLGAWAGGSLSPLSGKAPGNKTGERIEREYKRLGKKSFHKQSYKWLGKGTGYAEFRYLTNSAHTNLLWNSQLCGSDSFFGVHDTKTHVTHDTMLVLCREERYGQSENSTKKSLNLPHCYISIFFPQTPSPWVAFSLSLGRTLRCSGRRSTGDFQGQKALFYTEACFRLYSAVDTNQPCLNRMTQTSCFNGLVLGVYKGEQRLGGGNSLLLTTEEVNTEEKSCSTPKIDTWQWASTQLHLPRGNCKKK